MEVISEDMAVGRAAVGPSASGPPVVRTEILPAFQHGTSGSSCGAGGPEDVLAQILEGALDLTGADLGDVQLRDPVSGALRIAAHVGLDPAFVDHFATVTDDGSACGRAARERSQAVIADVELDQDFRPHRTLAAACGEIQATVIDTPRG